MARKVDAENPVHPAERNLKGEPLRTADLRSLTIEPGSLSARGSSLQPARFYQRRPVGVEHRLFHPAAEKSPPKVWPLELRRRGLVRRAGAHSPGHSGAWFPGMR